MSSTYKILQLTDLHLFKKDELLHGVSTNDNFQSVIDKIFHSDHVAQPDVIFLTGDLSQDEHSDSYRKIVAALNEFDIPICWIPGNHDCVDAMTPVFELAKNFQRGNVLDLERWRFIFLNTKLDRSVAGRLSKLELFRLEEILAKPSSQQKNIALVMHHPPVAVDSGLMDPIMLTNADELLKLLLPHKNVKLMMAGHVHNDYSLSYEHLAIETAPATCMQFVKNADDIDIEHKIGYKIYEFTDTDYQANAALWSA
ncbi:MAG: metallophosphoesterase [Gammaproteobacteria bacterium]|nr:metallophosphoesterase [Gammaproteobacteria bacterium]MCH9744519.1 metallophosphoesterase [Gammaproteobacteria bacterium]